MAPYSYGPIQLWPSSCRQSCIHLHWHTTTWHRITHPIPIMSPCCITMLLIAQTAIRFQTPVCAYARACAYVCVCMRLLACICLKCAYVHVCMCACVHVRVHVCACLCACMHACVSACACVRVFCAHGTSTRARVLHFAAQYHMQHSTTLYAALYTALCGTTQHCLQHCTAAHRDCFRC